MSWFRNVSLAKKLYGGFGVVIVLFALVGVVSYSKTSDPSSAAHTVSNVELAQSDAASTAQRPPGR